MLNINKNKTVNYHFKFWPIILTALLCSVVMSMQTLSDIAYVTALIVIISGAFIFFTKSIQERFIWLIALTPLNSLLRTAFEIDINPPDVIYCLLFGEIVLFYFRRHRFHKLGFQYEQILAILILLAVFLSAQMSPLADVPKGLIMRISLLLFLFIFGIKVFSEDLNFLPILHALSLRIIIVLMVCTIVPEGGVEELFGSVISLSRRYHYSHYILTEMSVSLPSLLILIPGNRRWFLLFAPIMFIVIVLLISCQAQVGYIILLTNLVCFAFFTEQRKRIAWGLILSALFIVSVPLIVTHFEKSGYDIIHKEGNERRYTATIAELQTFWKYPMFGIGINNATQRNEVGIVDSDSSFHFNAEYNRYTLFTGHNTLSQIAAELGLVGLIPMLCLLGYYFKKLITKKLTVIFQGGKLIDSNNTVNLLDTIVGLLYINRCIWLMVHDDPFSLKAWGMYLVFSFWIRARKNYQVTVMR